MKDLLFLTPLALLSLPLPVLAETCSPQDATMRDTAPVPLYADLKIEGPDVTGRAFAI